jgi:predicted MFS family arabinose efflux permease
VIEGRIPAPMVPLTLFRSPAFAGANLITLFLYAAIGIFFFLFPMELIQIRGYSTSMAGAAILPMILSLFLLSRWSGGLVSHYGARLPLIAGPLVVAAGFLLFAWLPPFGGYWVTFFPASLVLGLGMAVTVAPLTTSVMNSVGQDRAGTASGINNAVARVAGVLAIAVFGIVLVKSFGAHLDRDLAALSLAPDVISQIHSKEIELAGLELPSSLNASAISAVREGVSAAFLSGFRLILILCAVLSATSAIVAWRWIDRVGVTVPPSSS